MPQLPLDNADSIDVQFAMNGVSFDPLLPMSVYDEVCRLVPYGTLWHTP